MWTQEYRRKYARAYRLFYYMAHKDEIKAYSKLYHKSVNYKYQLAYQKRNYLAMLMYQQFNQLFHKDI